jgi:Fe-S cluster assembly protein SufD
VPAAPVVAVSSRRSSTSWAGWSPLRRFGSPPARRYAGNPLRGLTAPSRRIATLTAFSADIAASIDGPDWLRARRTAAVERFEATGLPSNEQEEWRYSRIGDLDLDAYVPVTDRPGATPSVPTAPFSAAATVTLVDGRLVDVDLPPDLQAKGVRIGRAGVDDEELVGSIAQPPADALAMLNDAFADPVVIQVPAGVTVDAPVLLRHHVTRAGGAAFPRLVVDAGRASAVTVVDVTRSAAVDALSVPVVELRAAAAANVRYVGLQDLDLAVWQIGTVVASVDQEATLTADAIALGGSYARLRTDCRLVGRGATGNLRAAYFGEGEQTLDFRTFQDHRAPDTTSDLLFKGAVGGRSRSVYTGLIRVEKDARGTNAFQTNRNVKLSDDAWAESVPNLEIENNDVHCSHASTVGPVDEEQRFYLESRGVPPEVADRLIVAGFFDEVVRRLPEPGLVTAVRARIGEKLDREGIADA